MPRFYHCPAVTLGVGCLAAAVLLVAVLLAPLMFEGQVDDNPPITLSVVGTLSASGTVVIPEPAALVAMSFAGVALLRKR